MLFKKRIKEEIMAKIKFKIYDKNRKRLLSGTGYSITGDVEVQTFNCGENRSCARR